MLRSARIVPTRRLVILAVLATLVSALLGPGALVLAASADVAPSTPPEQPVLEAPGSYAALMEQCVLSGTRAAHSLTVVGAMLATATTAHMRVKIELQGRASASEHFHPLEAPGLGVWNSANPGVLEYRDIRQVTNLPASSTYRVLISFLWLDSSSNVLKQVAKFTPVCAQEGSN